MNSIKFFTKFNKEIIVLIKIYFKKDNGRYKFRQFGQQIRSLGNI